MHRLVSFLRCAVIVAWIPYTLSIGGVLLSPFFAAAQDTPATIAGLEQALLEEGVESLAQAARQHGDPSRGAIVFYQPQLTCTKCHTQREETASLGPDLSKPNDEATDAYLVEAILQPSKVIKKGYEPVIVFTITGKSLTGLLVEQGADALVLRDPADDAGLITIPNDQIDEQFPGQLSVMPAGLTNSLTSRQQFLDLVRYLMEIVEYGPQRARQLEPPPHLYALPPIPEYEKNIDHAGMIADLDDEASSRGKAIYDRLCINCHGTHDQLGSLPTSLRFASGQFKHGADPHTMYQTLTKGFGMMMPQTWMVPQQKYDVVHYIREAYLKERNPAQYVHVDQTYLDRLPRGTGRGPEPSILEPWITMDYGPTLAASYEVGRDGTNFAYKGIAVRLDPGPGGVSRGRHWMLYDHDTLRVAAAWSGESFIDWNAILFNGQHGVHPRIVGVVHVANPTGPGWAEPGSGSFEDVRLRGRDDRTYGPLPRDWAHYTGLYHFGNQAILAYTVGAAAVLEMPGVDVSGELPVFTRTFHLGRREQELVLQVARHTGDVDSSLAEYHSNVVTLGRHEETARSDNREPLAFDGATLVEVNPSDDLNLTDRDYTVTARIKTQHDGRLIRGKMPGAKDRFFIAGLKGGPEEVTWTVDGLRNLRLHLPAGEEPLQFILWFASTEAREKADALAANGLPDAPTVNLKQLVQGGPPRWPEALSTHGALGSEDGPFAVDVLGRPSQNPWLCRMRFTGFDFLADGRRAAVCSWDGDVWLVDGIDRPERGLSWQRIASGLFQPLGLKIVDGQIFITCRDQIVILRDLNGDGETDFYENFNSDHQVTEHFHEFAMGLQVDGEGNFYYAKGARHAKTALVPQHGTLLRVSRDGQRTDILARGFRAPNGVCVNPDGSWFVTDQEGHWIPKNRINHVTSKGGFFGNSWGYHDLDDVSDAVMEQPLCWITNSMDRSPAELLWVDSDAWGPLKGSLLNTSYGYGTLYIVPYESIDGQLQGGVCPLPLEPFPTGIMRPRFHPQNGQLYVAGMFAWAGNQHEPGGLFRVRYTGKPVYVPVELHARRQGVSITFSGRLDKATACDSENYTIQTWSLRRSANYGSDHYDERPCRVAETTLSQDGKTVFLQLPDIRPTWCMEIKYWLRGADGEEVKGTIHNTIHRLAD